jgi:VWFA-related protein
MLRNIPTAHRLLVLAAFCLGIVSAQARAQSQEPTSKQQPTDDVVRVKTELVQTDVTVVDKRGRFVDGLKPEQFELRVDAKPQSLAFFEQVVTGSAEEEKQLAAVHSRDVAPLAKPVRSAGAESNRGRVIFFFVDDVHLSGESLTRARTVLLNFVENRMAGDDRVAIVSTSGQVGFLQQLTDNKAVLREAISRLNPRYNPETTASRVPISEVDANLITNVGDRGLFEFLVAETMAEFQMTNPINAVNIVKNRVSQINAQSAIHEIETLSRLERLMRSTAPLAGRKVVFFISDGFVVDTRRSSGADIVRRVGNEAARVGVVIYTLDTRSSFVGTGVDVSKNEFPDSPQTTGRSLAETKTPQEPLETLAEETGGRSYLNSNALDDGVSQALAETSAYYLLAWRPDTENQRAGKSRLDVAIKGRPDLRVRMRRHVFDFKLIQTAKMINPEAAKPLTSTPEDDLRMALGSLYPRRDLPTSVSAGFLNTADKGTVLNILTSIDTEMLSFDGSGGKQQAVVDVLGVALDDRGQFSSFKQKLEIPREAALAEGGRFVKWSQSLPLPPGLYQVRVAVRDRQSGRTGSAMGWIEIPRAGPLKK